MDVSSHDIEAETSEAEAEADAEVGMAAAVAPVPHAHVLIGGTTSMAMEGLGMTSCEKYPLADEDILVGNFGVQRTA